MRKTRHGLSYEDLDRLRAISRTRKAYTEPTPAEGTTGLRVYDLRGPARRLIPTYSQLRNMIPRFDAPRGSTAIHWKAITGINTGNILPGVSEGNRNATISQTTADYFSIYAGLGMENYNTFEAKYAGRGYADVEALARLDALEALMNAEERVILGGNFSVAFGVAPTPAGTLVTNGLGSLTQQTWRAYVVALTFEGMLLASVAGGVSTQFNRTNADGSVDTINGGSSNKSAESAGVVIGAGNATDSILWAWDSVPGAAGYAVYTGLTGAANCRLAAIVTVNEFLQTTNPSGVTQQASAITADNSQNSLVFDGIITQLAKSGSGAVIASLDGAVPTVTAGGTIEEFNAVFEQMWEANRLGPTRILINASTRVALSEAVIAAGGATPFIQVQVSAGAGGIRTGIQIVSILNPFTGTFVPFENHPYMPKGMAVFLSETIPYAVPGMRGVGGFWIETRQEYYSIKWPYRTRKDEWGVYVDEGLVGEFPAAHALVQNIGTN